MSPPLLFDVGTVYIGFFCLFFFLVTPPHGRISPFDFERGCMQVERLYLVAISQIQ